MIQGPITVTSATSSSRRAGILAVFTGDDTVLSTNDQGLTSAYNVSNGSNGSSTQPGAALQTPSSGLIITAATRAGSATITSPAGYNIIDSIATAAGSSDRGVALAYTTTDNDVNYTPSWTLSASQGWTRRKIDAEYVVVSDARRAVTNKYVIIGGARRFIT